MNYFLIVNGSIISYGNKSEILQVVTDNIDNFFGSKLVVEIVLESDIDKPYKIELSSGECLDSYFDLDKAQNFYSSYIESNENDINMLGITIYLKNNDKIISNFDF